MDDCQMFISGVVQKGVKNCITCRRKAGDGLSVSSGKIFTSNGVCMSCGSNKTLKANPRKLDLLNRINRNGQRVGGVQIPIQFIQCCR